ncbi:MAG: phosphate/phosphite/phosphonate ABC transporter substrate-binding protein, partial [Phycisphaerae bacterium]|nr:phosphate/phosphite/phosphonate ABC transporter substrate-binding protein [Phycisphaerae bacterium]
MFSRESLLMHKRAGGLCLVSLILVFTCTGPAHAEDAQNQVRIGVLAKRGPERCLEKWGPTAKYLSENIPGYTFEIVPLDFDEVIPAFENDKVDFGLVNPVLYVEVETFHGASRVVTLKNLHSGGVHTTFGGVIFHRADRDDIKTLSDLKGKTFMAV